MVKREKAVTTLPTKIIAVVNNKGGVGKTTSTVHIGHALVQLGCSVLCVDLDEQANLVQYFLTRRRVNQLKALQNGSPLAIEKHKSGVDVLMLSSYNVDESGYVSAIKQYEGQYDVILLDCPPALDKRTFAALTASEGVIIPTEADALAFSGTANLIALAEKYDTKLYGIFLCRYDDKVSVERAYLEMYQTNFTDQFLPVIIARSALFKSSAMRSLTGYEYKKNGHKDLDAYQDIAKLLIKGEA